MRRSVALGAGGYLPDRIMMNAEIAALVDTSDEWIVARTGIRQRHLAADHQKTSDLAIIAAERALKAANIEVSDIDLIVLATATPDETFPATATTVQAALGMTRGFAFDVQAVCSGFLFALSVADSQIKTGQVDRALVIGAEIFSRILDWEDRGTCVLFGDGAGAIVLEGQDGKGTADDRGILASCLHSDGRHHDLLYVNGGPASTGTVGVLKMRGKEVFRHAVTNLSSAVTEVLDAAGLEQSQVDWIVPHQANKRILDATARKLGISGDKVIVTVDKHANTSAASVPLALATAIEDGRIKKGDLLVLEAMGGGFTWGAAALRW